MKKRISSGFLLLATMVISSITVGQTISPNLVGTNLWYTNPSATIWNLTKQCGIQTIRIGGAEYDRNMPSKQTILSWVKQVRAIGAEPIVQVSQYKSAAVAAELVTYLNVENKGVIAPVKYWSIGNEPWLQNGQPAISTVGAMVEKYFKPISEAMKAVDPTIKIYGPDFCYYIDQAINDLFGGKNNIAGKIPGKEYYYCDGISWHTYPQDDNIDLAVQGLASFKASIIKCKQKVDAVNLALNRTGEDALVWGIGEFNAKGGPMVHSFANGLMFGGILGLCMKYEAKYAATWSMYESGGNRQGTDFSMIDGNMTPRASYRHMEMVARYFKGRYVDGTSSSNDFIVYGAKDGHQTSVMIMHRGFGYPKEYTLQLNTAAAAGPSVTLKVDADSAASYSDMISERTTQVIIFRGDSIVKINYSSVDFDKGLPPTMATVKVATRLPDAPTGLKGAALSHIKTSLTWTDVSDNELGFIIEREIGGIFKPVGMVGANSNAYNETGLLPETAYRYRVVAYNSLGKSNYSAIDTVTTLASPVPKAYKGPHSLPGKIEAEDFDVNEEGVSYHDTDVENKGTQYRTTGVDIERSTDTGLGYNVAYIANGEWLTYLIESVTPGTYDLALRTASNVTSTTKKIEVFIDNVKAGQVAPANTGGWQAWQTNYITNIEIKDSQPKLVKLLFSGTDYNLNWFQFGKGLSTSIQVSSQEKALRVFFEAPSQQVHIVNSDEPNWATVRVFNTLGQTFYSKAQQIAGHLTIDAQNWPEGIYLIAISNDKGHRTFKVQVN
jgi:hypothetical protein